MAWTTPRTWTTGEIVTAAIMNTHIRDNENFLRTSIAYSQITADVTVLSTVTDVVDLSATTFDGTDVWLEFFSPSVVGAVGETLSIYLYDGSTQIANLGDNAATNSTLVGTPVFSKIKLTPSAASHTYKVQAQMSGATTGTIHAGNGSSGNLAPTFLRAYGA